jgi:hypothetical protein
MRCVFWRFLKLFFPGAVDKEREFFQNIFMRVGIDPDNPFTGSVGVYFCGNMVVPARRRKKQ